MTNVPEPPTGANPPAHVDLTDPAARAAWLAAMRESTLDALAAGEDQTRPPGARDLGRREARRILTDAGRSIGQLLAAAGFVPGDTSHARPLRTDRRESSDVEPQQATDGGDERAAFGA